MINELQDAADSNFRYDAQEGMMRFGGSFCKALGYALAHADSPNANKIMRTFNIECVEHSALYRKFIEKRDKEIKDVMHNENIK